jgi:L-lactate utilization protein LutB
VPVDVEKNIEFILDTQAKWEERWVKNEERWAKAEERWAKSERRMDRLEKLGERLVRAGLSMGSDVREVRRDVQELKEFRRRTEQNLAEITERLDALIDIVDKSIRRNGRKG